MSDVLIRLTTSLARHSDPYYGNESHQYRPGEKYRCPDNEARKRIAAKDAVECDDSEPDYIPPDGTEAMVVVNKTIREQTTTVQPRKKV